MSWTQEELQLLHNLYSDRPKYEVLIALPDKKWQAIQTHATRLGIKRKVSTEVRFWDKVDNVDNNSCWEWQGKISLQGYGHFYFDGSISCAHRYSYILNCGDIPDGFEVHHTCYNKACVNPNHLELMTHLDNVRDASQRIIHCPYGHEYTEENTKLNNGMRQCRQCANRYRRNIHKDQTRLDDHDFMEPDHIARFLRNYKTGVDNLGRHTLAKILKQYSSPTVLDIACGSCVNFEVFRRFGVQCQYIGYDRTRNLLHHARTLYGDEIRLDRGYAEDLPYVDHYVDVSILRHIGEHMLPKDFYTAIQEAIRVSKSEVIIVFFETPQNIPEHIVNKRSSNIPNQEVFHYWNVYSWSRFTEFIASLGVQMKYDHIQTPGAAHADTIVRLIK